MRNALGSLIMAVAAFAPTPASAEERCYYLADVPFDAPQVRAAVDLVMPFAPSVSPSADREAAQAVYMRILDGKLRSTSIWIAAETLPAHSHDRLNGVAVELEVRNCARGLNLFRRYLERLSEVSTDEDVSATLSTFRQSVREISAEEYARVRPQPPTI